MERTGGDETRLVVPSGRRGRRRRRLRGRAAGAHAEDPVDLGGAEVLVGLAGRDDEVGGELHLAEQVGVLERHVELVVHGGSFPASSEPPGCPGFGGAGRNLSETRVVVAVTPYSDPNGW